MNADVIEENIDLIVSLVQAYALPVLFAIIIYIVGKWIAKVVADTISKIMTKRNVDEALIGFAHSMIYWALFA